MQLVQYICMYALVMYFNVDHLFFLLFIYTFNLYFIIHIYFFYLYGPLSAIKDYYYYYYYYYFIEIINLPSIETVRNSTNIDLYIFLQNLTNYTLHCFIMNKIYSIIVSNRFGHYKSRLNSQI